MSMFGHRLPIFEPREPARPSLWGDLLRGYQGKYGLYARIRRRLLPEYFLEFVAARLPDEGRVLDIGCGIGLFTLFLAARKPCLMFTGLEFVPARVTAARSAAAAAGIQNVSFSQADAREPRFAGGYDAVLLFDVLHHLPPSASTALLKAAFAALRPGGVIIVKEIDTRPRWAWGFTYLLDLAMAPHDRYGYFSRASRGRQISEAGFSGVWSLPLATALPYPHIVLSGAKL